VLERSPIDDVLATCDEIVRGRLPNFFRLYLNPFVAQACACLDRLVRRAWPGDERYQSFLANSFDEALSGAIKLARYHANWGGRPPTGLVVDPNGRLGPFAAIDLPAGRLEFVPGLSQVTAIDPTALQSVGFVVLVGPLASTNELPRSTGQLVVRCVDRSHEAARGGPKPDIVVFDESFVDRQLPFGAFCARKGVFAPWNDPRHSSFHSTTFQPNTISVLHFLRCLERADPEFFAAMAEQLAAIRDDIVVRSGVFRELYSPSLAKTIAVSGFHVTDVQTAGHSVAVGHRSIFDAVAGVACSIRGHNPVGFVEDLRRLPAGPLLKHEAETRLRRLTGLGHVLPAVSGASAVENALRVGLATQFPRTRVLALRGGFGGKTLLALTGTANPVYKTHLDPVYSDVAYIDPFSPDAIARIDAELASGTVGVVQLELIQAVGGVRAVPDAVVRHLAAARERWRYLLFVDEVQTGMFRTGPFCRSSAADLQPDLLTVGKGTSDMMVPFALTLVADEVARRLAETGCGLDQAIEERSGYEIGYRTVVNVLRLAEAGSMTERVSRAGERFATRAARRLAACRAVRQVRTFGLLIGVELETRGWPGAWLRKRVGGFYLLNLLRHSDFPVLAGFCQYEPNVLKLTPPLTITDDEIDRLCDALGDVLHRRAVHLVPRVIGSVVQSSMLRRPRRRRVLA